MTGPIEREVARLDAPGLADMLGYWSAADGPLYRLLAARIAKLADTGSLPPGLRLPPERALAAALNVSRNTVATAYQLLRDEGMAESRQGSGTRIVPHRTTPAAVHRANGFFAGLLEDSRLKADLTIAAVECAPQVAAALDDPASVLSAAERRALTSSTGYLPLGAEPLRAAVASVFAVRHGMPTDPGQVIITTGAQQAIDLLIRCELLPGQPAIVEDPTFPGVLDALHRAAARVIGLPASDGADPDRLGQLLDTHRPGLVYLIPTNHNPTGQTMPASARQRIAGLAAKHKDTTFVDDMTLTDLSLTDAPPPPPLASLAAGLPNVVTVSSLSKLYWGGLRTGWIRGHAGMIGRLSAAKAAVDLGSTAYQQAIVAALLAGRHDGIIKWRADWLRRRHAALRAAMGRYLPGWQWAPPDGGLSVWARLPPGTDSGAFAQAALRHGVAVVPGRLLSAAGGEAASAHVRLAFTQPPEMLQMAVATLGRVSDISVISR